MTLNGKYVWVLGGGSGIGRAGAEALAEGGASVVVSGRRPEMIEEVAASIRQKGGKASALPLDVADADAVQAAAATILKQHGHVDILVNSAGVNTPKRYWRDLTPEAFKQVVDINYNGALYAIAAVLPSMRARRDGLVINVSSWAGRFVSYMTGPAYTSSKHAMVALTQSLNMEECVNNIRGCVICPAEVATPILKKRPKPPSEEDMTKMLRPEDLGRTIRWVAEQPAHVCVNEILISPTWNRAWLGGAELERW